MRTGAERFALDERTGAEELRLIVRNLDTCRESFNDQHTADELLQIGRMWLASDFDISPDHWTPRQVREALKGRPPTWDANERPTYGRKAVGSFGIGSRVTRRGSRRSQTC